MTGRTLRVSVTSVEGRTLIAYLRGVPDWAGPWTLTAATNSRYDGPSPPVVPQNVPQDEVGRMMNNGSEQEKGVVGGFSKG